MKSFSDEYLDNIKFSPKLIGLMNSISEYKGKEELYSRQSPDILESMTEVARVESAESSNRLEGIIVKHSRIKALIEKNSPPKNRSEEEIAGYRDVLDRIHTMHEGMPVTENVILMFHSLLYKYTNVKAGEWKKSDNKIIDRYKDGTVRIRFAPPPAFKTPEYMEKLLSNYDYFLNKQNYAPLVLIPLFVLDFLCIHPFTDGNGRTARLITLLLLYKSGYKVGKYISIERIIEQSKNSYYDALETSSKKWHEKKHNPLPWLHYFYGMLLSSYKEFEERVGIFRERPGSKRENIIKAINNFHGSFSISDIENACPNISRDMVRKVLREERDKGQISAIGIGRLAKWHKKK